MHDSCMYIPCAAVQDRLNGFIMTAAAVWCILAMVTIILQASDAGHAVIPLWCAALFPHRECSKLCERLALQACTGVCKAS